MQSIIGCFGYYLLAEKQRRAGDDLDCCCCDHTCRSSFFHAVMGKLSVAVILMSPKGLSCTIWMTLSVLSTSSSKRTEAATRLCRKKEEESRRVERVGKRDIN